MRYCFGNKKIGCEGKFFRTVVKIIRLEIESFLLNFARVMKWNGAVCLTTIEMDVRNFEMERLSVIEQISSFLTAALIALSVATSRSYISAHWSHRQLRIELRTKAAGEVLSRCVDVACQLKVRKRT